MTCALSNARHYHLCSLQATWSFLMMTMMRTSFRAALSTQSSGSERVSIITAPVRLNCIKIGTLLFGKLNQQHTINNSTEQLCSNNPIKNTFFIYLFAIVVGSKFNDTLYILASLRNISQIKHTRPKTGNCIIHDHQQTPSSHRHHHRMRITAASAV